MRYTIKEKQELVMRYQNGERVEHICAERGIARSTFYSWIKPFQTTVTQTGVLVTPHEYDHLRKRVKKLEEMIEVLKMVSCTVSAPLKEKLSALEPLYGQYSVYVLCEALEVARGTFYNHIFRSKRNDTWYMRRRAELCEKIRTIFEESHQIYGADKIRALLVQQGVIVSNTYVTRMMREMGLVSVWPTAKKDYRRLFEERIKRDIIRREFHAEKPNQVWVSDITCFVLRDKRYYIAMIMDLFSRKIIAYKISAHIKTRLITTLFKKAYEERKPEGGLIFHSDRGSQYTALAFRKFLFSCGVEQSFSRSGNPLDNAVAESFFSSMKREELYRRHYRSLAEFERSVAAYIQFYNAKRPHRSLNYKCPNEVEQTQN